VKAKYFYIVLIIIIVFSCEKKQKNQFNITKMNLTENIEIKKISESLKTGMIEYIQPGETEYNEKDVEKCMKLIDTFLTELTQTETKENGMKFVEKVVLKLNELNEKCEYELIETDQREQLAEIINLAGNLKGYSKKEEDITEEWREW
jgi:hypothetical protein